MNPKDPELHELLRKLSRLESTHDHLSAEMQHLDAMLKEVGFQEGLETLKQAAHDLEMIESEEGESDDEEEEAEFDELNEFDELVEFEEDGELDEEELDELDKEDESDD